METNGDERVGFRLLGAGNIMRILTSLIGKGILGMCLLWAGAGLAARQRVEYSAAAGYAGAVRDGALFPVVVTISNRVARASGEIRLVNCDSLGKSEVTFRMPVQLPLNSVKRFECLMRAESGRIPRLSLVFDGALDSITTDLKVRFAQGPLLLAVDVPLSRLAELAPDHFTLAGPGELFDDPLAYDGLYALAVSGRALVGATPAALAAVKAWVCTGGRLVVVEPLQEPLFLKRMEALTGFPGGAQSCAGMRRVGSGWAFCAGGPDIDKGAGALRFAGAGTNGEAVNYRRGYTALWNTYGGFGAAGIAGMLLIVIAYLLAIGPGDFFLCRRWRRPSWTWPLFGAAILFFSLMAWGLSRYVQAGRARLVQLTVIDAADGVARAQSMAWFYSTRNAMYSIGCGPDGIHMSACESFMPAGGLANVEVSNGRRSRMRARVPVFSDRHFDFAGYLPWPETIEFHGGADQFSVGLPSSLPVDEAFVVGPAGLAPLTSRDGRWVREAPPIAIEDAVTNLLEVLDKSFNPKSFNVRDGDDMPSSRKLAEYLKALCLSFPHPAGESGAERQPFFSRREDGFSMEDRARWSGMLVLLLKPGHGRLSLTVGGCEPDRIERTMVRIPIPRGAGDDSGKGFPASPGSTGDKK